MLRYTTDRARPGLVALYDIRPGNGAGQFLQPLSPHRAIDVNKIFRTIWIALEYKICLSCRKSIDTLHCSVTLWVDLHVVRG